MMGTFTEYYLDGLLLGMAVTTGLGLVFLFLCLKGGKRKTGGTDSSPKRSGSAPVPSPPPTIRRTAMEVLIYCLLAGLVFLVLWLWITPTLPFDGTVVRKETRTSHRTYTITTYYISVVGDSWSPQNRHTVDRSTYDAVRTGDRIRHTTQSPCYTINGVTHRAAEPAGNIAFWGGSLLVILLALITGTIVCHLRRRIRGSGYEGVRTPYPDCRIIGRWNPVGRTSDGGIRKRLGSAPASGTMGHRDEDSDC